MPRSLFPLFVLVTHLALAQPTVLPQPASVSIQSGTFRVRPGLAVFASANAAPERIWLQTYWQGAGLPTLAPTTDARKAAIVLQTDSTQAATLGAEGYDLTVLPTQIRLVGSTRAGLFYGLQTLRQLLPASPTAQPVSSAPGPVPLATLPALYVRDQPRFGWRSFMLDEGRHFQGMAVVKQLLDELALLKVNRFHWHLTEDQGWRIEIRKYPKLTEIGSQRAETQVGDFGTTEYDGKPHGGFYTQEQIREIVRHAEARHITIVPEIEMPGHCTAAIASYRWLGATNEPMPVATRFGITPNALNIADPRVMQFCRDVLTEVMALFPNSPIIHIGGDELRYDAWKVSRPMWGLKGEKMLPTYADVQAWFTNQMGTFLQANGRRLMGWNDMLRSTVDTQEGSKDIVRTVQLLPGAVVHFWKGDPKLMQEAAQLGHPVVNATAEYTYLSDRPADLTLAKVYGFDPLPTGSPDVLQKQLWGVGYQLWGEETPTAARVWEQLHPRLVAAAEVAWTQPNRKSFERFSSVLPAFEQRWLMQPKRIDTPTNAPVKLILDTDIGPDYDDVGAMAVMHTLADSGYVDVLATVASNQSKHIVGVLDVLNTYCRRPNVPVGVVRGRGVNLTAWQGWDSALVARYPHRLRSNAAAEDAVALYRRILASQPDTSVTICTIGFLTNLADLLLSSADQHSPLSGRELVQRKVKRLVSMAGKFPQGKEFNVDRDPVSSRIVFGQWPTEIIFSGFEIGYPVRTGLPLIQNNNLTNSPIKDAFAISIPKSKEDAQGRMSWDETAVLVSIKGHAPFYALKPGRFVCHDDGSNRWDDTAKGHYHLVEKMPATEVAGILNRLMMR